MRTISRFTVPLLLAGGFVAAAGGARAEDDPRAVFFETRVRPVLAEHCYSCHGPEKQKGGLRVDNISTLLAGGDNGAAIAPGAPDSSRMLVALSYANVDLQMPPNGRLPEGLLADLKQWIADGAYWPDEPVPSARMAGPAFDLNARRAAHWAWQPIQVVDPPVVQASTWPRGPIDQ